MFYVPVYGFKEFREDTLTLDMWQQAALSMIPNITFLWRVEMVKKLPVVSQIASLLAEFQTARLIHRDLSRCTHWEIDMYADMHVLYV